MSIIDKVEAALRRNPEYADRRIAKNVRGSNTAMVNEARARLGLAAGPPEGAAPEPTEIRTHSHGVVLHSSTRVLSRRPAESAAKYIKRLPKGRGYDPKELSHDWGMSEETIRRHARDLNCLKFVEVSEDEWKPLVMNPETASKYAL